jgi:hypothetical protein
LPSALIPNHSSTHYWWRRPTPSMKVNSSLRQKSHLTLPSQPSISVHSASIDSTNYAWKKFRKNFICSEHVQTFFLIILQIIQYNNSL